MSLRRSIALLAGLAALALAPSAGAQPGLLLGVDDDALKWAQHPAALQTAIADLGLGAVRFTQTWRPGESRLSSGDAVNLDRAVANAQGLRIVLSVYGVAGAAPQYAAVGASAAPAAYEALLAACYGPLHTARAGVNVIATLAPRGKRAVEPTPLDSRARVALRS